MIRRLGLTIDPITLTRTVDDENDCDDELDIDVDSFEVMRTDSFGPLMSPVRDADNHNPNQ